MRSLALTLLLAACGAPADEAAPTGFGATGGADTLALPVDQAGPVTIASISATALVTANPLTVTVQGVTPGIRMTLAGSANVTGAGYCPPAIAPTCVDIAAPFVTLGTAVVDGAGVATFTVNVPAVMPPEVEIIAYGAQGPNIFYTPGALLTAYDNAGDEDADGLPNGAELAAGTDLFSFDTDGDGLPDTEASIWGTDPLNPDTDGGGTTDGDEVGIGADPLDPADDVGLCGGSLIDPGNGILGCWYTAPAVGMTCDQVCAPHGGFNVAASTHSGNAVGMFFWPGKANGSNWVSVECSSTDNNTNWGASGAPADPFFSHSACHVNCACNN